MKKNYGIIHLSDLHFGRIHPETLEHLDNFLIKRNNEIKIAIVTGDLTQRARKSEFIAATKFIKSLNHPLFVVPGNHDVPLYNLWLRFLSPYKKFLKYLGPYSQNYYEDDDIAVFGLWTVNNFAATTGRLRKRDLMQIEEKFHNVPEWKLKIVACHHPLLSIKHPRIKNDIKRITDLHPHFILWGHEHQSGIIHMIQDQVFPIIMASGTATSSRIRNEANSFNYIHYIDGELLLEIYRHSVSKGEFELINRKRLSLRENLHSPSDFH